LNFARFSPRGIGRVSEKADKHAATGAFRKSERV
jgi:hypothetical protein